MKQFVVIVFIVGLTGYVVWAFANSSRQIKSQAATSTTTETTVSEPKDVVKEKDPTQLGSVIVLGNIILDNAEYAVPSNNFNKEISDYLQSADCRIAPIETPLKGQHQNTSRSNYQEATEKAYDLIDKLNINIAAIGISHFVDQGNEGLDKSTKWFKDHSISYSGASNQDGDPYQPAIINCGRLRVGLLSSTDKTNYTDNGVELALNEKLATALKTLKAQVDFAIVMTNWGDDASKYVSPYQRDVAHELVDNGADLVIGNHPQFIQSEEVYKTGLIFYSLGNFLVPNKLSENQPEGIGVKLDISAAKVEANITPLADTKTNPSPVNDNKPGEYLKSLSIENWFVSVER